MNMRIFAGQLNFLNFKYFDPLDQVEAYTGLFGVALEKRNANLRLLSSRVPKHAFPQSATCKWMVVVPNLARHRAKHNHSSAQG